MKAWVYQGAGQAALEQRPWPHRTGHGCDCVGHPIDNLHQRSAHPPRRSARPQPDVVLGHEFVGRVEELGRSVRGLHVGDRVAANCISFCGECWYCRHGFINNCQRGGWLLDAPRMAVRPRRYGCPMGRWG